VGVAEGSCGVGVCDDSAAAVLIAVAVGAGPFHASSALHADRASVPPTTNVATTMTERTERVDLMRSV